MDESMSSQSSSGQSNNNVIMFPKKNIRLVPPVEDDKAREIARRTYIDEVIDNYAISLLNKLAQQGFGAADAERGVAFVARVAVRSGEAWGRAIDRKSVV